MSSYAWAIITDHLAEPEAKPGTHWNAVGVIGPFDVELSYEEIVNHPDREFFQMLDDDGEIYYEGYLVDLDGEEPEVEFCPLYDYGLPNAGAVHIKYRNPKTGEMELI